MDLQFLLKKTKVLQLNTDTLDEIIVVDENKLENVSGFCYLGHTIFNDDSDFTGNRITRATAKFNELCNVIRDKEIRPRVVDSSFIVTRAHQKIKSYFAALILIILNVINKNKKNVNKICTKLKIIICMF